MPAEKKKTNYYCKYIIIYAKVTLASNNINRTLLIPPGEIMYYICSVIVIK